MTSCHLCGRAIVGPIAPTCECAGDLVRYREALETIASNINACRPEDQLMRDILDSWHYIARKALDA